MKKSFARIYATLKARELKTLRQLDAIRKQCEDDKDLMGNCVRDLHLCFGNESNLLENIYNYSAIDFETIKFDSKIFTLEDYVSPESDHMYSYKTIEELTKTIEPDLDIEEAALKQVTAAEGCVCYVNIRSEDVSKQFRDPPISPRKAIDESVSDSKEVKCTNVNDEKRLKEESVSPESDADVKKIEPTDEWMNSIKSQTETEPTQITDVMEHSTITCI